MKKKVVGIAFTLALVSFVYFTPVDAKERETVSIVDTQELPNYLTEYDFSKLYTCREDVRKKDDSIVEVSYEDARLLLCISRAEGGDTLDGQLWTMRTILNRVQSEHFPYNVYDVVNQHTEDAWQFEVVKTGVCEKAELNSESHLALAMIESGWNNTQGALYWEACTNSPQSWHAQNLEYIKTVEGNRYYK